MKGNPFYELAEQFSSPSGTSLHMVVGEAVQVYPLVIRAGGLDFAVAGVNAQLIPEAGKRILCLTEDYQVLYAVCEVML